MDTHDTIKQHNEFHVSVKKVGKRQNWLRAAVLGANDGIVSVAAILFGVAGASASMDFILTAGIAGLTAGALSMAVGEYVSVSTQRDTERAMLEQERTELLREPEREFEELVSLYAAKGLRPETARTVAEELTKHDAFAAHADAELQTDPDNLTNPFHAALASALAFTSGGIIPLCALVIAPPAFALALTCVAVFDALILTGILSAYVGGANKWRATIRVVLGGVLAMIITFGVGKLFGVSGI